MCSWKPIHLTAWSLQQIKRACVDEVVSVCIYGGVAEGTSE